MKIFPDKLPEETELEYRAFTDYCELGAGRNVAALERWIAGEELHPLRSVPYHALLGWSKAWEWRERAEKFDAEENRARERWLERQGQSNKLLRVQALEATYQKFVKELGNLNVAELAETDPKGFVAAMKQIAQELRAEYDDQPTQRTEETRTIDVNITKEEVQKYSTDRLRDLTRSLIEGKN